MAIQRIYKLYLNAGVSVAPVIHVNQYDSGEQWIFDLYTETGTKYTPKTGAIVGLKSDGNAILNTGTVNSSGQVVINETRQMTASAGKAVFELLLDSETHGTANFIVDVEERPADNASYSDSDLSLLEEAISASADAVDAKDIAVASATSAQSSASTAQVASNSASTSATNAKTYELSAKEYAEQASSSAGSVTYSFMVDTEGYLCLHYNGD